MLLLPQELSPCLLGIEKRKDCLPVILFFFSFFINWRIIALRRAWQPTAVFLPGESHGQRSLVGYSPRSCKELDTTERLSTHACIVALQCCNGLCRPSAQISHNLYPLPLEPPNAIPPLFTIARTQQQPRRPSTGDWIPVTLFNSNSTNAISCRLTVRLEIFLGIY